MSSLPTATLSPSGLACLFAASLLALSLSAQAQYANSDAPDWKEDTVPPPPSYSVSGLVEIEMPRTAAVKIGLDPKTITLNQATGIVRYVVVARGPSAVNASYEGIRCATGEFRIYARQVQGGEWTPNSDNAWKPMQGQSSVMVQYPLQLARSGMCMGTTLQQTPKDVVRALQTNNQSLYY